MCSTRLEPAPAALGALPDTQPTTRIGAQPAARTPCETASEPAARTAQRLALRRHQLVGLSQAGWRQVLAQDWRADQRDCLQHWADHGLPLVLARQDLAQQDPLDRWGSRCRMDLLALGLPAPSHWYRQRLSLQLSLSAVQYFDELPSAAEVAPLLPATQRAAWLGLCRDLRRLGLLPQVFGSFGWQQLTGLSYLRPGSDIDLLLPVDSPAQADAAAAVLVASGIEQPRLDGELVFADGSAVAWREWQAWRKSPSRPGGDAQRILVKRLDGVTLEAGTAWLDRALRSLTPSCGG